MRATIGPDGLLRCGPHSWRAAIGKGGIRPDKQEGDGATPAAILPLRRIFYRADRTPRPNTHLPTEPTAPDDGWCDAPNDPAYNRHVRLPYPASTESLWRDDNLYNIVVVLGWNDSPPQPHRGSAIFLHIARPNYAPTEGCIALTQHDLHALLTQGPTELQTLPP